MNHSEFKRGVFGAFKKIEFSKHGSLLRRSQGEIEALISVDRGFHSHIDIGFWLNEFGEINISKMHKSHAYFRLGSLFPEYREVILTACDLGESDQATGYSQLMNLIPDEINRKIYSVGSPKGLRAAYLANELSSRGFIQIHIQDYLSSGQGHVL